MKNIKILLGIVILSSILTTYSCSKEEEKKEVVTVVTPPILVYKFTVTKMEITSFPLLDNGGQWDLLDDADVYYTINDGSTELYTEFFNFYTDVNTVPISWNLSTPEVINNVTLLRIDVVDKEVTNSTLMGSVTFDFNNYISSKPTIFSNTNGDYTVKITGFWN